MNNPFNVGDSVTVNESLTGIRARITRDTTQGKAYKLTHVGVRSAYDGGKFVIKAPLCVTFIDDVGDNVTLYFRAVTLATGE